MGTISLPEFLQMLEDHRVRAYLNVRGIEVKDAEMFFRMLSTSSGTDEVDIHSFVEGCLRLKGLATSVDLHQLRFEHKRLTLQQRAFENFCGTQFAAIMKALTKQVPL